MASYGARYVHNYVQHTRLIEPRTVASTAVGCIANLAKIGLFENTLDWLETDLPAHFMGRILPIDSAVADRWGRLVAAAGRPLPAIDSLLAATALEHDLILFSRNVKDFAGLPVQVFNPWLS